jgi:hypothetical protein
VWRAVGNPQLTTISLASTCLLHEWQANTLQKTQLSPSRVSRQRLVESSKMGPSSNIWHSHYQIEIARIKNLSAC